MVGTATFLLKRELFASCSIFLYVTQPLGVYPKWRGTPQKKWPFRISSANNFGQYISQGPSTQYFFLSIPPNNPCNLLGELSWKIAQKEALINTTPMWILVNWLMPIVMLVCWSSKRTAGAWKWQVISKVGWGARIALQHVFLVVLRTRLLYFKV